MGATATVKGGLFESAGLNSLTQVQGTGASRRFISQQLSDAGLASLRKVEATLNGVAPGQAAVATRAQVEANAELGGKRTITQTSVVNRNTTNADVTEITNDILAPLTGRTSFGASPPANKDGNPLGTR